jgi:hypothetical protein
VNCTVIQRRLLAAEQPAQPPAEVKSHLAQCPSCRTWQRRLIHMERQLHELPVPPSTAKDELLERILGTPSGASSRTKIADTPVLWRSSLAPGPKERGLRKVSVAFALAASLLVFALAWWSWPRDAVHIVNRQHAADRARLEARLTHVLEGETPKERILLLANLAEEVHGEARHMTDNSERVQQWARFYARVVGEHLVDQARQLPEKDRPEILQDIAQRLVDTESTASRFAAQLKATSPSCAASFDEIALVSRKGEQDLRALMKV